MRHQVNITPGDTLDRDLEVGPRKPEVGTAVSRAIPLAIWLGWNLPSVRANTGD